MSLLGRQELEEAVFGLPVEERLIVTPLLDRGQIGRGAIDLRLGTEFLTLRRVQRAGIDPSEKNAPDLDRLQERVRVPFGEGIWLHPEHFVLAATLEYLRFPDNMGGYVVGRSSWGRLGLIVATAVFVHPGFRGCLTLELVNEGDSPIRLCPGFRVAQIAVHRMDRAAPARGDEEEKYLAPVRPQASRLGSEGAEFQKLRRLGRDLRSRLGP